MNAQDNKIIFVDENGNEIELTILFTCTLEEKNRTYYFFYEENAPEEIHVGYLGEDKEIHDIEDDEYEEVEAIFAEYLKEQE